MNEVILTPDGSIARPDGVPADDPLPLLGHRIRMREGYTLRSFFSMLARYPALGRLGEFLEACMQKAAGCPAEGCRTDEFEYLELAKTVEMVGFPGKPRLDIYTTLAGIAEEERIDIRFMDFDYLLDMPVRLGRLRHIVLGDAISVLEFETAYSLYELIEGIAWELGFHGAPKQCSLRG